MFIKIKALWADSSSVEGFAIIDPYTIIGFYPYRSPAGSKDIIAYDVLLSTGAGIYITPATYEWIQQFLPSISHIDPNIKRDN